MTQEEFFKRYIYDIRADRIGGGGFGTVYKAYDRILHREVAIKVSEVKTAANGKVFSLKDEFDALQHLPKHPNIANYEELYSFAMPNGFFDYAVMQYYPDGNLTNLIGTALSLDQKEEIALQLLEGVAFLHEHKVVHRDLKPGNILIARYGKEICPIITDFGLSKTADTGDRSMFSNSFGGGTARYSSPEQLQGKPLRMNTDLWSYGAVVYELFAGQPLFEAGSSAANSAQADLEIYNKIINGDTEGRLSDIPDKWRKVLERCMVVDPEKRAKSAEELRRMLSEDVAAEVDKTILADEVKGDVEEDRTVVEVPQPPKKEPVVHTPTPTHPLPSQKPKPDMDKDKTLTSHKRLPWIISGGVAAVVLAVIITVLVTHKPEGENTPLSNDNSDNVSVILPDGSAGEYTINGVSFTMKYVEGGTFRMGATSKQGSDTCDDEKPVHSVTVSDFCIGETEVTQELWKAVMGSNPSHFKGDNLPVENVSWNDCQEFIQKLNQLTGKTFRLPTEAEWEYAARGGNKSRGYKYSGSNTLGDVAWYDYNSGNNTHPVKTKSPNELGLYDMSGNVWEWCQDWFGNYSISLQTNPEGPSSGSDRVLRGGSWPDGARYCRVSPRLSSAPGYRNSDCGFRLALVHQ